MLPSGDIPKKYVVTGSKLVLRYFPCANVPKLLSYFKSVRSKVFNALSTISIAHTERARYACKVASWKQNFKIKKYRFSNFFIRPIEISIHREYSSCPYYPNITWSWTLDHTLSNALSTIFIRQVERAQSTFKVAHKNTKSKKSTFWSNRTQKILENSCFGFRRNFF